MSRIPISLRSAGDFSPDRTSFTFVIRTPSFSPPDISLVSEDRRWSC